MASERIEEALEAASTYVRFAPVGLTGDALHLVVLAAALRGERAESARLREALQAIESETADEVELDVRWINRAANTALAVSPPADEAKR